jgi:hypothetical protein
MDRPRHLLLLTCTALAKVQYELYSEYCFLKQSAEWYGRVRDLERPSAWLDGVPSNFAVTGVVGRMMRVQTHLLAMIATPGDIDGLRACVVLQHIAGDTQSSGWSKPVLRLAAQLGVSLPAGPAVVMHQTTLHNLPAEAFPVRLARALPDDQNRPAAFQPATSTAGNVTCNHPTTHKKRRRKASDFARAS